MTAQTPPRPDAVRTLKAGRPDGAMADMEWSQVRWAVVDVEGNGQPDPDLVEIAIVPVVDGVVQPARSWLVRPPRLVHWRARAIHGLSDTDLADAPTAAEIAPEVLACLGDVDVIVGHQVRVDLAVLHRCLPGWPDLPALDTLRLSRATHPDLPSHRLTALVEHFALTTGLTGVAHRAGYDATVTARLLVHLATTDAGLAVGRLLEAARPADGTRKPSTSTDEPPLFEVP